MSTAEATTLAVALLQALGGWKMAVFFAVMLLFPLLLGIYALQGLVKATFLLRDEVRRYNADAEQRYQNNIILVEQYEKMSRELMAVVRSNIEANARMTTLLEQQLKRVR